MERFANAMREARARKKMSQKELSGKSGVATSTISSYESGGKIPPLDIAVKIARALDVSLDALFELPTKQHSDNSFGDVIRHIDHISASMHTVNINIIREPTPTHDIRMEIYILSSVDKAGKEWTRIFVPRWQNLLSTVKEYPELREMYSTWIEKKISEAKICTLDKLPV